MSIRRNPLSLIFVVLHAIGQRFDRDMEGKLIAQPEKLRRSVFAKILDGALVVHSFLPFSKTVVSFEQSVPMHFSPS